MLKGDYCGLKTLQLISLCLVVMWGAVAAQEDADTVVVDTVGMSGDDGPSGAVADSLYPIELIPVDDSIRIPVLDFKNTDVRDILRAVGMQYGVNVYIEPDVRGDISLYLVDIPVRNALDFIVKRSKHAYTVENGIVKVYKIETPPPPPPPKPQQVFHREGGLLEIDLRDLAASDVARMFTDSAGVNVVVEGQGDKKISGRLSGIAPEKAVKVLFESAGFQTSTSDNVFYVSSGWSGDQNAGSGAGGGMRPMKRLSITVNKDKTVTMEVDNAALDQVIRTIAIQSGINVIIYDQVTGTITAKFDSIEVDNAFRFLLQNTKFTFWKDRDIYFVGSRDMSQQKTSVVIPLRHIMADEAELGRMLPPHVVKSADIKFDKEHNAVVVIGSFDVIAQAQEYLEKIDRPIPQVLIEALVVDFNLNRIREFGVSLFTQSPGDSAGNWLSEQFVPGVQVKPGKKMTERLLRNVLNYIGIDKVVRLPSNFRASLHALETADVIKVHSTPQIATINGNPASITIGETRYFKLTKEVKSSVASTGDNVIGTDERFEKIELNTTLQVTPWVMDQGYVIVKIRPEFRIPRTGGDLNRPPTTDTRVLESMVRLKDGQTIVLGGQRQTGTVVNNRGVPFLSSIPILGTLFSHKTTSKAESQMMIFLTPHVYYGDDAHVSPDDYFGEDIQRILDENDPDRFRKRREERREEKEQEEKMKAAKKEKLSDTGEDAPGRKRRFPWPFGLFQRDDEEKGGAK